MIKFNQISKIYPGGNIALKDIDFEIANGDFISIVGRSGAGKSTLLKLIIREDQPTEGTILIEGTDIAEIHPSDIPVLRRKIGVVFQDIKLLPSRTVFENVAYAMEVAGVPKVQIDVETPQFLGLVGLEDKAQSFPDELSGGEKQRVAIARALAYKPQILLADEPTGNLDALHSWDIVQLLIKINKLGTTVLLATHNDDVVNALKKRVITLNQGKVVSDQKGGTYKL